MDTSAPDRAYSPPSLSPRRSARNHPLPAAGPGQPLLLEWACRGRRRRAGVRGTPPQRRSLSMKPGIHPVYETRKFHSYGCSTEWTTRTTLKPTSSDGMVRSPTRVAVAVLRPHGSLGYLERRFESVTRRIRVLGLPVVRGAVSLFETLALGITALNFSAEESSRETGAKAAESAGPWLGVLQAATVAISLGLGVLLFVVLPARI